jgi:DNA-binding HxlR family transcriptional regulator
MGGAMATEAQATGRSYRDRCGVARALDVVGERWALLVVRELLFGPKRFGELRTGLPHVSPNVLSERLRDLEAAGIVRTRRLGPPASAQAYELTERGRALRPVLVELGRWGSAAPLRPRAEMSVDSHMLALLTLFDARAARGVDVRAALRVEHDAFLAHVGEGRLRLERGEISDADADAVIETDRGTLRALLWEGRDLGEAIAAGEALVQGSRRAARRFLRLFPRA